VLNVLYTCILSAVRKQRFLVLNIAGRNLEGERNTMHYPILSTQMCYCKSLLYMCAFYFFNELITS